MLRADDVDRRFSQRPPVGAPGTGRGPGQDIGEVLGSTAAVVRDRQRRVAADDRHHRLARLEAALDVQRFPRADFLVFGDAKADLAHLAESGPVQRAWHRSASQADQQPERPADRQVCPVPWAERAHAAVHPSDVPDGSVNHDELPGRLRGDGLPVHVEPGIECCPDGRDHDREVIRAAPGQHRACGHPPQRGHAHRGRDLPERLVGVEPAQHFRDSLRCRRNHRQTVGPAALEHLLELVVGAGRRDGRGQVRVDGGLRRAAGLAQRLGRFRDWQVRARRADQGGQRRLIPPGDRVDDDAVRGDQDRGRYGHQPVKPRGLVRRILRDDVARPAAVVRDPEGDLKRVLEDCRAAEAGGLPCQTERTEIAQRHRRCRALLRHEQQQSAAACRQARDRDRLRIDRADGQLGCHCVAACDCLSAVHVLWLSQVAGCCQVCERWGAAGLTCPFPANFRQHW